MRVIRSGEKYSIVSGAVETYDLLPVGTYRIRYNDREGFYMTVHPNIEVKEKVYGVHEKKVNKVMASFEIFERSLGVILSGDKGIGKSIAAKMMCQQAVAKQYPVIIVDEAYKGIARFIEDIEQECMVLFDEFDKIFKTNREEDEQAKLLSLFDGTAGGKKMYIVTCNELRGLNDYIVNRPGRFHYHFRFEYPSANDIREYLKDKIVYQYHGEIEKVVEFSGRVDLNYDCLRSIAFELNQGNSFNEAVTELNILSVELEEYDVFLYYASGEVLHKYRYKTNLYDGDSGFEWVSLYSDNGTNVVDVKFEKRHLRYDIEKRALVIPAERLLLDYEEEDDKDVQKRTDALYLAFVKCAEKRLHYVV